MDHALLNRYLALLQSARQLVLEKAVTAADQGLDLYDIMPASAGRLKELQSTIEVVEAMLQGSTTPMSTLLSLKLS